MNTEISKAAALMGKRGGEQRKKNLSPERRTEIARKAGRANKGIKKNKKVELSTVLHKVS